MAGLLDLTEFVVKHRPKVVEVRVGYDVYDTAGRPLASVVQVGRDNLEKTLHPQRADNARTSLELRDTAEAPQLALTHIQALKSSLEVADVNATAMGTIRLENLVGKSRFALQAGSVRVGAMKAKTWRKKNFVVTDANDGEVARIDMTRGSSGDFAHENDYAVRVLRPLEDPLRSLAIVAVIAVDMILWSR